MSRRTLKLGAILIGVGGPGQHGTWLNPLEPLTLLAAVATHTSHWFEAGAFDGISLSVSAPSEFARFTGQVLPILRERGVVRGEYDSTTLRGNLGLPVPENRYTAARQAAGRPATPAPAMRA